MITSLVSDTSIFDFSQLKDLEKQNQTNNDQLDTLLDQNNLIKKKLPPVTFLRNSMELI